MASDDEKQRPEDNDIDSDDEKAHLLSSRDSSPSQSRSPSPEPDLDARFNRPTPSPVKRAALLVFIGLLLWIGFQMRSGLLQAKRKPQIIHASRPVATHRYSKEHKFRPAASPIITETLKDGRIRLRGAMETPTAIPSPPVGKKKRTGKGKKGGKSKKPTRRGP